MFRKRCCSKKRVILLCVALLCVALSVVLVLRVVAVSHISDGKNKQVSALYLYGDMTEMTSKKDIRTVTAQFEYLGKRVKYDAAIKIQGNSSLKYEKKNYTITFYQDVKLTRKKSVDVGWGEQSEYCLKANWIDKTHSRNIVTAKLATEVQDSYNVLSQAPRNGLIDGFPVALYINDEFHGLYTWNIPKSAWMFDMDADNPNHIVLCGEDWENPVLFKDVPDLEHWSVEVGPENEETLSKFTRLTDFIMNSSDEEFKNDFEQYMDLDAALNYYILIDFAYLPDNRGKNMLMVTYDGQKWYPSLYDLDTSWGTHWAGLEVYDYKNNPCNFAATCLWAQRLKENFPQELHDRYFALRDNILTKEHVMNLFYEFDESIPAEIKVAEITRWGNAIPGYDFTQIEDYLDYMIPQLDEVYTNLIA